MIKKTHILMAEWWTVGRKIRALLYGIAGIAVAIMSRVQLSDMYAQRIETPKHMRCFTKFNDSINTPKFRSIAASQKEISLTVLKVSARQEVMMSERMIDRSDSIYKRDSVEVEKRLKDVGY